MKRLDDKWYPISELPEEFKDGRTVLFWCVIAGDARNCELQFSVRATYFDSNFWEIPRGPTVKNATHFREIVSPQEEAMRDYAELSQEMQAY